MYWGIALVMLLGCQSAGDRAARERVLASGPGRNLVGTWDLVLTIDSRSLPARRRPGSGPVSGTLVLTPDHHGPTSSNALQGITHVGAYDLDVSPFGFTTRGPDDASFAVARLDVPPPERAAAGGDSLWVVLSPESDRFPLRMRGLFMQDSALGVWSAESFSVGGGSGRFEMRRHRTDGSGPH